MVLTSFAIYAMVSSFQGGGSSRGSSNLQDWAMRWAALVPAASAVLWIYLVFMARHSLRTAMDILDFSSRILTENPALLGVGMGSLGVVVLWTWAWLAMFTRVFLGGYFSTALSRFVIGAGTWWLGVYFVLEDPLDAVGAVGRTARHYGRHGVAAVLLPRRCPWLTPPLSQLMELLQGQQQRALE